MKQKGVPFSKDNNPIVPNRGELIKKGIKKKKALKLLMKTKPSKYMKNLMPYMSEYIDMPEDELTVEILMHAKMIELAIQGDVKAYQAVMSRCYGAPKQEIEQEFKVKSVNLNQWVLPSDDSIEEAEEVDE